MNNNSMHYKSAFIQFSSQILTLSSFVLFTPIYLSHWTQTEYKTWILYIAAFQIIEIFDFGLVLTTTNRITKSFTQSRSAGLSSIEVLAKSLLNIDLYIGSLILLIFFFLSELTPANIQLEICIIFLANSIINHWFGFVINISRVTEMQVHAFLVSGFYVFFQSCVWAFAVFHGFSLSFTAFAGLLYSLLYFTVCTVFLIEKDVKLAIFKGISSTSRPREVKESISNGNANFLGTTLISLLSVHAFAFIAGALVTPVQFIAYTIQKTLTRVLITTSMALGNSHWSKFAQLKSENQPIKSLSHKLIAINVLLNLVGSLILLLTANRFLQWWSNDSLEINNFNFLALILLAWLSSLTWILKYIHFGTSNEKIVRQLNIFSLVFGVIIASTLGILFDLTGIIAGQILSEFFLLGALNRSLKKLY